MRRSFILVWSEVRPCGSLSLSAPWCSWLPTGWPEGLAGPSSHPWSVTDAGLARDGAPRGARVLVPSDSVRGAAGRLPPARRRAPPARPPGPGLGRAGSASHFLLPPALEPVAPTTVCPPAGGADGAGADVVVTGEPASPVIPPRVSPYSVIDIAPFQEDPGPGPQAVEEDSAGPHVPSGYSVPVPCGYAVPSSLPALLPAYSSPVLLRPASPDGEGRRPPPPRGTTRGAARPVVLPALPVALCPQTFVPEVTGPGPSVGGSPSSQAKPPR